jgi:hypothetical protein
MIGQPSISCAISYISSKDLPQSCGDVLYPLQNVANLLVHVDWRLVAAKNLVNGN